MPVLNEYGFRGIVVHDCLCPVMRGSAVLMRLHVEAGLIAAGMRIVLAYRRSGDGYRLYSPSEDKHRAFHEISIQHLAYAAMVGAIRDSHTVAPVTREALT